MIQHNKYLLLVMFSVIALPLFLLTARSTFQDARANDTTSAYYLCYGRNINRYPFSTTKLMNIDLVAPEGRPIFKDKPVKFYRDHPPLLTWMVAIALKIKCVFSPAVSDLLAGRMVSILASIGILLMTVYICQEAFGTMPAIMAGFSILSCPVFLSHGLVVNFEPLCCCLILLGFLGNSPFLFVPALLVDWPAFFALPVYSILQLRKRNQTKAILALGLGLLVGFGIMFLYGYLSGEVDFMGNFIKRTASLEVGRYLHHGSDLFSQAKAIVRTMVLINFGPLNCIVVFVCFLRWIKHFNSLNRAQMVGVASVIVTLLNIVLFHTWAAEHSFWTYYLLPAVAIAYSDLVRTKYIKIIVILCLSVNLLYSSILYVKYLLIKSPTSSAEEKSPVLINAQTYPVFTDTRHAYFGHGYVARWYFDRPLEFASSPLDSQVKALCSTQTCIWIAENQYIYLPIEQFDVYKVGHYGNTFLTTFQVKKGYY